MPRTPTFSSPPNFWETCLHSCCTFLTPQPSGSLTLCTMKTVLTRASSAWESHWKLFQVLLYMNSSHWAILLWCFLPLASGMSLSSGFWSYLLTFYLQSPLEYQCSPGSVLGYLFSPPSHSSLANTVIPSASTTTKKPVIMSCRFCKQHKINPLYFYCKNCSHYTVKWDLIFRISWNFSHKYSDPPVCVTCHIILCVWIFR